MKMIRELFALLKITRAVVKEKRIENKLCKHKIKVLEIYGKYENSEFEMPETKYWLEELHKEIISWRKKHE